MKTKKIILFIVEGITDENSLALILSKIINNLEVRFHIVYGDITADKFTSTTNVKTKVNDQLKIFLNKNKFKKTDILQIIHLTDTDGAFVSPNNIFEDNTVNQLVYKDNCIITNNKVSTEKRNKKKSEVLEVLINTKKINKIPYTILFFSCNLEHVLHNIRNASNNEKSILANNFIEKYYPFPNDFIDFISNSSFTVHGTYKDTWAFIKKNCNSLNRYSNFHLYFHNFL